jgi:hypothetical protein
MRERADRTIQQPVDTSLYLNVPELGIIPSEKSVGSRWSYARSLTHSEPGASVTGRSPRTRGHPDQVELATWQRKPSIVAESFRSTLISILFASDKGSPPKVLVLTSTRQADRARQQARRYPMVRTMPDLSTYLRDQFETVLTPHAADARRPCIRAHGRQSNHGNPRRKADAGCRPRRATAVQ